MNKTCCQANSILVLEQLIVSGSLKNWSKYALWCTDKKTWLIAPRATLNTYGLDAGMVQLNL